ncbi:MAG: hypothetical protein WCK67_10080 [bacterium]
MMIDETKLNIELLERIFNKECSSKKSIVDYANPETFAIAYRIREGLEMIQKEAENRVIKKTIIEEFGKEYPSIEEMVLNKVFNGEEA